MKTCYETCVDYRAKRNQLNNQNVKVNLSQEKLRNIPFCAFFMMLPFLRSYFSIYFIESIRLRCVNQQYIVTRRKIHCSQLFAQDFPIFKKIVCAVLSYL